VPIRLEIGMQEVEKNTVFMGRRDQAYKERRSVAKEEFLNTLSNELDNIQQTIFERALKARQENLHQIDNQADFYEFFKKHNGFVSAHWNGDPSIEAKIKKELGVTIRCIPLENKSDPGKCIFTGESSNAQVIFAKAY
jgi:prolyl-tRNA synthetase